MAKNPYSEFDPVDLWELELVADKYCGGNVMLIRTTDGWRVFLGEISPGFIRGFEEELEKLIPFERYYYERMAFGDKRFRECRRPNLQEGIREALVDCMIFEGYSHPGMLSDELEDKEQLHEK